MEVLATEEGLKKEKDVMDTHTMDLFMSSPPIIQRNRGQNERENIIFLKKKIDNNNNKRTVRAKSEERRVWLSWE